MEATLPPWWLAPAPGSSTDDSSPAAGLSGKEARARLARDGPNLLRPPKRRTIVVQYLMRLRNPLVLILLAASAVSAFSGEVANFIMISTIVLLSITLDFAQDYRANAAAEKLRLAVSLQATVLRDGQVAKVAVTALVRGDVVLLAAGDLIPADGRVLEAKDFFVRQALLTGESYPVEKRPGCLPDNAADLQDASNAVFMGSSVVSGSARILVMQTGDDTVMGDIASNISEASKPTSAEIGTRRFGMLIMRLTVLMVTFVLLVNTLSHKPLLETFLFAVALAVGLTPELLPMVVSVTLSRGALRMAGKHTIVKRLSAIQDLGSMDVLCTDKTGTLTEGTIRLEAHVDTEGNPCEQVLALAYLNSYFESGLRSPIDDAILGCAGMDASPWKKIDEVPFDFERRRVSVLVDDGRQRWLVVKGAPDDIVALCSHYQAKNAGEQRPVDDAALAAIRDRYHGLERQGLRVLGIAWRPVPPDHPHAIVNDESELVLAGFLAFIDPPKASAASALTALEKLGITIKIVTGDSDLVTRHVCVQLGIPVAGVLTGSELAQMDDHALQARAETVNLFCRVNPSQKNRVILALKARGHVVGYLGDGINDAPPLHSADVGLSVDSAVDVAKEAADIILLRRDLHVLHAGVLEGRRTFGNILKYIMMGTSSNFGNMFSMAAASLFLPFLPMLPTQILLNNILYDISEMPIPFDRVDAAEVRTPRTLDISFVRNFMLIVGPISSLFDFLMFYILLVVLKADEALFQTGWFVESLCTQVLVIFIIRTRGNPLKSRAHPLLTATSLSVVGVALLLPFTPAGVYFGMVPPPARFYLLLTAMVLGYLTIAELTKQVFYRRLAPKKKAHRKIDRVDASSRRV